MPRRSPATTTTVASAGAPFWAVIPAGGSGTRLWPVSRTARPKFLLPLRGAASLLEQTAARLAPIAPPERTLVVCGPGHAAAVARLLPDLPDDNILVEPAPKGSGPAIGLAAALIERHDPDAIMGSFAADHEVCDEEAFARAVGVGIAAARTGWLTTIGLEPTRPETGFGYVERTDEVVVEAAGGAAYRAACFVEKPDRERAEAYVAAGRFLWNASMFLWRAGTLMAEIARLQPDLHVALRRVAAAWGTPAQDAVAAEVWAGLATSTIDQGIMERAARVAVVPCDMGWSDIGDWNVLGQLGEPDAAGNSLRGDVVPVATTNSAAWSETGRLIAMVGLDNVVVVDTEDALLVADRARSQEVRQVVELLKERRREELT
ncbi:MAG: sugar phosphate nucleotidyltransferase [Chloroflexota bacterium]|nr:sugar phosphate nucleotidyltransferase [Chloroflexota bacterium]